MADLTMADLTMADLTMTELTMPSLGADMESGLLVEWLVGPGDVVTRGQVVAVVETDKGAIEIESFDAGTIEELLVEPETEVPVGAPMARLRGPAGREAEPQDKPKADDVAASAEPTAGEAERVEAAPGPAPAAAGPRGRISPRARKLAAQLGVSLDDVSGTGPGGSITGDDVRRAADARPAAAPRPDRAGGMRAVIAAAMSRSKREIPHYYLAHTVDLEPALVRLEASNAERNVAERILPVALLVRAVARGLREFPELCGWWRGGGFVPAPGVHVGLAVSLRDGGLVNPAIHDADQGSLGELFARIRDVTKRARAGQLRSSELSDAAITVTNLGDQGVEAVLGVIHPPQVAIVGVGRIAARPWVVDGAVVPRRLVTLSLSADHRVSDGHRGGRFLRLIDKHLQELEPDDR